MEETNFHIRKALIDDVTQVTILYRELMRIHAENMPSVFCYGEIDQTKLIKEINESSFFYVICISEIIIGYCKCMYKIIEKSEYTKKRTILIITDLFIHERYRNQGIGSKVLHFIEKIALNKNITHIEIPVYAFNEQAKGFYNRNGYFTYVERKIKEL